MMKFIRKYVAVLYQKIKLKTFSDPIFIIPITLFILIATIIQLRNLEPTSSKSILISINLCIFALLLMVFFVVRNLYKTYGESRHQISGSGFGTRLIIAFVGFILVPSMLLFILSSLLVTYTVDKWFKLEFQRPIKNSQKVANIFYLREKENALKDAKIFAAIRTSRIRNRVKRFLEKNQFLNDPTKIYLLKKTDGSKIVGNAFKGNASAEIISTESGDVIRAVAPVVTRNNVSEVVVVETLLDAKFVKKMDSIEEAYTYYNQLERQQHLIKLLYFLVLAMATLLIIYLSIWISIRIARGITGPILTLSKAANTVTNGNMNVRINVKRDDEIGILINSFNTMISELREGKVSLEKAYRDADRGRLTMEAILENINTGVIFLSNEGHVITVNNAACTILSIDCKDYVGDDYRTLVSKIESEELFNLIRRIREKGFNFVKKVIKVHIENKMMDVSVHIMALKDSENIPMGILVVFADLTEIIKAQRALAWQEVAKRIAHEIKNPLTPIKLSTERLIKKKNKKADDFDSVFARATTTIIKEVDSLKSLVDGFSRLGKMPTIDTRLCNINKLIQGIMELYKDYKTIFFASSLNGVPEVRMDREQIKRVIINLIENAIHAKAKNIKLSTCYEAQSETVSIEVIDDGVGINREDKDKLFLPYFSTKKSGTGLGLAIADKIVSEHGGNIKVRDNDPVGTVFSIELPAKG